MPSGAPLTPTYHHLILGPLFLECLYLDTLTHTQKAPVT